MLCLVCVFFFLIQLRGLAGHRSRTWSGQLGFLRPVCYSSGEDGALGISVLFIPPWLVSVIFTLVFRCDSLACGQLGSPGSASQWWPSSRSTTTTGRRTSWTAWYTRRTCCSAAPRVATLTSRPAWSRQRRKSKLTHTHTHTRQYSAPACHEKHQCLLL